jgi:DNA-binding response OmpR family regulator
MQQTQIVLIGGRILNRAGVGAALFASPVAGSTPNLVLLDVDMPRLDGMGVLEEIRVRVRTATLPVIVPTARGGETGSEALELGADDFLARPVQPRSLTARGAVLKRARP